VLRDIAIRSKSLLQVSFVYLRVLFSRLGFVRVAFPDGPHTLASYFSDRRVVKGLMPCQKTFKKT
jgi:hypothetical protein